MQHGPATKIKENRRRSLRISADRDGEQGGIQFNRFNISISPRAAQRRSPATKICSRSLFPILSPQGSAVGLSVSNNRLGESE